MIKTGLALCDLALIFKVTADLNRSNLIMFVVVHLFSLKQH